MAEFFIGAYAVIAVEMVIVAWISAVQIKRSNHRRVVLVKDVEDVAVARSHAKWVKHCLQDTHDLDYLPGDVRVAMMSLADNVINLASGEGS